MASTAAPPLRFRGCADFRLRLILATLSSRRVIITDIRARDGAPGLRDFEAGFLRLLSKLSNGCTVEINDTGTSLKYAPGFLVGGAVEHDCGTARGVGWYLEGVLPLAPFGKKPLALTLRGITGDDVDHGVDALRELHLPQMAYFGVREGLALETRKRGCAPAGGGEVRFTCPVVRELKSCSVVEEGFVKHVRGVAFTCRVSPQVANRVVDGVRGVLNNFLADVFITTDAGKGSTSGDSPGFGVTLVATSTSGCVYTATRCTGAARGTAESGGGGGDAPPPLPEDLGRSAASLLLDEVERGGCIDSRAQPLVLLLMALGPEDVSRVRLGQLSPAAVATLRLLKAFFGVTFKLTPYSQTGAPETGRKRGRAGGDGRGEGESKGGVEGGSEREGEGEGTAAQPLQVHAAGGHSNNTVLVSCMGIGFKSIAKRVT